MSKVEVVEKPKSKDSKGKYRMSEVEYVLGVDVRIEETEVREIKRIGKVADLMQRSENLNKSVVGIQKR